MRANHDVVTMNDQISNGSCWKIQTERLPTITVVKRYVDCALSSREKKAFAFRVFANSVDRLIIRNAAGDFRPALASIMCAIDVRMKIIKTKAIHGRVNSVRIEMGCLHLGDLAPGRQFTRRDILPDFPRIVGDMN